MIMLAWFVLAPLVVSMLKWWWCGHLSKRTLKRMRPAAWLVLVVVSVANLIFN